MSAAQHVVFIQGGGAGAHDDWDATLVDSLARELGDGYDVRYPRMPQEDDPSYAPWSAAIERELMGADDGVVVIGHSVGATILINYLAEASPPRRLGAIALIAAPFVGAGGWPGAEFAFTDNLDARLPHGVPVHLFHGLDDQTVPSDHARLYLRAIPHAQLHLLPGRDHQLNNDVGEVARAIAAFRRTDVST
jgi:predicted alpha/beta hydrolase family esterase